MRHLPLDCTNAELCASTEEEQKDWARRLLQSWRDEDVYQLGIDLTKDRAENGCYD